MSHGVARSELLFSPDVRREACDLLRRRLSELHSPIVADPEAAEQLLRQANAVLDDVTATSDDAAAGTGVAPQAAAMLSTEIGVSRATQRVAPTESLRAAAVMFEVLLPVVAGGLRDRGATEDVVLTGTTSLHRSILQRLGQGAMSYATVLLEKVNNAHRDERHRIARELHDQAAHAVGVALQDLELHDVYLSREPDRARLRVASARTALNDALAVVRHLAQELRESPSEVGSLERALSDYVTWRVPAEIRTKLSVVKDIAESGKVCGELYFVLREAIRNTVVHAQARNLQVLVARDQAGIHATVRDDGQGFAVEEALASPSGIGLSSMRERLELLNGTLHITSAPGVGTTVSIRIADRGPQP